MRYESVVAIAIALLSPSTLAQTPAPPTSGNPPGAQYVAALTGSLSGSVIASSSANGSGVEFQINVLGLPASGGPFFYYLSPSLVCSGDPPVLDPYDAQAGSGCSQSSPHSCAVGDLWGKHGKMEGTNYNTNYLDLYLSTIRDAPAFLGGSSVVIQSSNKTNLVCAPFASNGSPSSGSQQAAAAAAPAPLSAAMPSPSANSSLPMAPGPVIMPSSTGAMPLAVIGPAGRPPQLSSNSTAPMGTASAAPPAAGPPLNTAAAPLAPPLNIAAPPPPPAAVASAAPPALTSTPGVVAGFTPGLNGPASTVTVGSGNDKTVTLQGTGNTVTQTQIQQADMTVTVTVMMMPAPMGTGVTPPPAPPPPAALNATAPAVPPPSPPAAPLAAASCSPCEAPAQPTVAPPAAQPAPPPTLQTTTSCPPSAAVTSCPPCPPATAFTIAPTYTPSGIAAIPSWISSVLGDSSSVPPSVVMASQAPDGSCLCPTQPAQSIEVAPTAVCGSGIPTMVNGTPMTLFLGPSTSGPMHVCGQGMETILNGTPMTVFLGPQTAPVITIPGGPSGITTTDPAGSTIIVAPNQMTIITPNIVPPIGSQPPTVLTIPGGPSGLTTVIPPGQTITIPANSVQTITLPGPSYVPPGYYTQAPIPKPETITITGGPQGDQTTIAPWTLTIPPDQTTLLDLPFLPALTVGPQGLTTVVPGRTISVPARQTSVVVLPPVANPLGNPIITSGASMLVTTMPNPDTTIPGATVETLTIVTAPDAVINVPGVASAGVDVPDVENPLDEPEAPPPDEPPPADEPPDNGSEAPDPKTDEDAGVRVESVRWVVRVVAVGVAVLGMV